MALSVIKTNSIAAGNITPALISSLSGLTVANTQISGIIPRSIFPAGSVVQTQTFTTGTGVTNNTTSWVDTGLTVSITPTSATNKILVTVILPNQNGTNNYVYQGYRLYRGATLISSNATGSSVSAYNVEFRDLNMQYLDSPASTSAQTYKVQFAILASAGQYADQAVCGTVSGVNRYGTITVQEIVV